MRPVDRKREVVSNSSICRGLKWAGCVQKAKCWKRRLKVAEQEHNQETHVGAQVGAFLQIGGTCAPVCKFVPTCFLFDLLVDFLEANRKSIRSAKRSEKGAK